MKTAGVIAEYNPFHNGHKYLLEEIRRQTGADYIIVVMSGDFTQRGIPAITDKFSRARMALENGADLVLELPVCYATASAPYFADGAVSLLDQLGIVDTLCFGSECGFVEPLMKIAELLQDETPAFQENLQSFLKEGLSFPLARKKALENVFANMPFSVSDLLSSPNNILGIEYCRALLARKSSITPWTLKRQGGSYLDPSLSSINSSALAIRTAVSEAFSHNLPFPEQLKNQLPPSVFSNLSDYYKKTAPVLPDFLSLPLHYKLIQEQSRGYTDYFDITPDLSDRMVKLLPEYTGFTAFCDLLKTKDMTYTRISRCLLHIFLSIRQKDIAACQSEQSTCYARILGIKKDTGELLSAIKKHSCIPLISKLADSLKEFEQDALKQLNLDIEAAHLYRALVMHQYGILLPIEQRQPFISV